MFIHPPAVQQFATSNKKTPAPPGLILVGISEPVPVLGSFFRTSQPQVNLSGNRKIYIAASGQLLSTALRLEVFALSEVNQAIGVSAVKRVPPSNRTGAGAPDGTEVQECRQWDQSPGSVRKILTEAHRSLLASTCRCCSPRTGPRLLMGRRIVRHQIGSLLE